MAGEQLLQHALRVLDALGASAQAVMPMSGERLQRLRIGALPSVAPFLLPSALAALRDGYAALYGSNDAIDLLIRDRAVPGTARRLMSGMRGAALPEQAAIIASKISALKHFGGAKVIVLERATFRDTVFGDRTRTEALMRLLAHRLRGSAARVVALIPQNVTPFLVQVFVIFFGLPAVGIRLEAELCAVIAIVLNGSAYSIEIVRAGIESIGHGQTEAAHALCLNIPRERREHFVAPGVGHYGIFSGRRWREIVYPKVREFLQLVA